MRWRVLVVFLLTGSIRQSDRASVTEKQKGAVFEVRALLLLLICGDVSFCSSDATGDLNGCHHPNSKKCEPESPTLLLHVASKFLIVKSGADTSWSVKPRKLGRDATVVNTDSRGAG